MKCTAKFYTMQKCHVDLKGFKLTFLEIWGQEEVRIRIFFNFVSIAYFSFLISNFKVLRLSSVLSECCQSFIHNQIKSCVKLKCVPTFSIALGWTSVIISRQALHSISIVATSCRDLEKLTVHPCIFYYMHLFVFQFILLVNHIAD